MLTYVHSGIIRTALPNMDREARQEYDVVIQAKDMGGHMGGLSGTTEVKITLTDVNDNPPKFPQSEYKHLLFIYNIYCKTACNVPMYGITTSHITVCLYSHPAAFYPVLHRTSMHVGYVGPLTRVYMYITLCVLYIGVYNPESMSLASNIEAREVTVRGTKDKLRNQV